MEASIHLGGCFSNQVSPGLSLDQEEAEEELAWLHSGCTVQEGLSESADGLEVMQKARRNW